MKTRGMRIEKTGTVVSNKMTKTVTVQVSQRVPHPRYQKVSIRNKKYYAHYDGDTAIDVGTVVRIAETRPLSKTKRWRVVDVVEKANNNDLSL